MKIGIDLDGVIFDTEKTFRVYSELYDMLELKQNSKENNYELKLQDRFNWSEEQINDFFNKYCRKIMKETSFMPGAKEVLKMLKKDGHSLIIITARGGFDKEVINITHDRLKKANMDIFDKYFFEAKDKAKICQDEGVFVMIDDSLNICKSVSSEKIHSIYLKDAPSSKTKDSLYLKTLYNWGEIYRYLNENKKASDN